MVGNEYEDKKMRQQFINNPEVEKSDEVFRVSIFNDLTKLWNEFKSGDQIRIKGIRKCKKYMDKGYNQLQGTVNDMSSVTKLE